MLYISCPSEFSFIAEQDCVLLVIALYHDCPELSFLSLFSSYILGTLSASARLWVPSAPRWFSSIIIPIRHIIYFQIFKNLHIVAIHRADCIDELSWALLPYILNSNRVALMITVELRVSMRYDVLVDVLDNPTTTVMRLVGINRWHHSAIVCQALHVDAISPDLEKWDIFFIEYQAGSNRCSGFNLSLS